MKQNDLRADLANSMLGDESSPNDSTAAHQKSSSATHASVLGDAGIPLWFTSVGQMAGSVDTLDPRVGISGWVLDRSQPDRPIAIELMCADQIIARTSTSLERPDITASVPEARTPGFCINWETLDLPLLSSIADSTPGAPFEIYIPLVGQRLQKNSKSGHLTHAFSGDLLSLVQGDTEGASRIDHRWRKFQYDQRSGFYFAGLPPGWLQLRSNRVCIVTSELHGLFKNGGIGTANTGLARELADAGLDVTVLYFDCDDNGPRTRFSSFADVAREYKTRNITVKFLPRYQQIFEQFRDIRSTSYAIYLFLRDQGFSAIYFNECGGQGFYSILAARAGAIQGDPVIGVVTHGSNDWTHELNSNQWAHGQLPILSYMEKKCVQYADFIVSPSEYLLNWMKARDWTLPKDVFYEKNIVDVERPLAPKSGGGDALRTRDRPVSEIVFFGRQEVRKGVRLFCDAMDIVTLNNSGRNVQITFLGKFWKVNEVNSGAYILMRSRRWNLRVRFLSNLGQEEALHYLAGAGRLAVIPSLAENSPCVVAECLQLDIPFIATDSGGTAELVSEVDRDRCLVAPDPRELAKRLTLCLNEGHHAAQPATTQVETCRSWRDFHAFPPRRQLGPSEGGGSNTKTLSDSLTRVPPEIAEAERERSVPLVSVCIVHHNRPGLLKQAFESALGQDYPRFEIVVVDDGSDLADALDYLTHLEGGRFAVPVHVVRQKNLYLGAARNAGAQRACGDYFLFVDDDNLLLPTAITDLVRAAGRFQADIVTGVPLSFYHTSRPDAEFDGEIRMLPLGGCAEIGLLENCFGDANALVSRRAFEAVGGFHQVHGDAVEDWEFFAKATLLGLRLEVLPKPTFWYRVLSSGMFIKSDPVMNARRIARVYYDHPIRHISRMLELLWDIQREQQHRFLHSIAEGDGGRDTLVKLSRLDPESKDAKRLLVDCMVEQRRTQDALDFALHNDVELLETIAVAERKAMSSAARQALDNYQLVVRDRIDLGPYVTRRAEALRGAELQLSIDATTGSISFRAGLDVAAVMVSAACPPSAEAVAARCVARGDTDHLKVCLVVCATGTQLDLRKREPDLGEDVHVSHWQELIAGEPADLRVDITATLGDAAAATTVPRDVLMIARGRDGRSGWCELTWSGFSAELVQGSEAKRSSVVPEYNVRRLSDRTIANRGQLITRPDQLDPHMAPFVAGYPATLHPVHAGLSAIRIPRVIPPGAAGVRSTVSVVNDKAHPVQFGMWTHPSASPLTDETELERAATFSGWLTVLEKHVQKPIQIMFTATLSEPHDVYLATRVLDQSNVWFCHALIHDLFTMFKS